MHMHINMYGHVSIQKCSQNPLTSMHTHTHTHMHAHTHTHTHTHLVWRSHVHTHTLTRMHASICERRATEHLRSRLSRRVSLVYTWLPLDPILTNNTAKAQNKIHACSPPIPVTQNRNKQVQGTPQWSAPEVGIRTHNVWVHAAY